MKTIIKNGLLVDIGNNLNKNIDILVEDEHIIDIGYFENQKADFIIDADDCIVIPGLIDHHVHIYPFISNGIPAEAVCFSSGVTTAVDAGSCGCDTYEKTRDFLQYTKLTIKSYLNISSMGLSSLPELEKLNPELYDISKIKKLFEAYPEELIGLKLRTSKNIVKDLNFIPMEETIKIANELKLPVMIHCTNPPGPMKDVVDLMRKGDILTHMYQNIGYTLLDDKMRVSKEIKDAREKGIIFEAADARAHFSFEVSEKAIKDNFLPDIIATDLTHYSMYQRPTAFSLMMQIAKYEMLGIKFEEVIRACTEIPAKKIGLYDKFGGLKKGHYADIAIIKKVEKENEFGDRPYYDPDKQLRSGSYVYNTMLTMKKGEIVYRNILF
ncbi:amidohydrolase family protein [Fusobacterium sp. PH5-44]|uniref:amidohydrolase family protein n=1 Tax=unclassified Fusobacterium TaxID=2648384 RepID=UPI003D1D91CF